MTQVPPPLRVAVVAPSSVVGQVELTLGVEFLRSVGFEVRVDPQCSYQHFTFAGTDEQRATAFFDAARDPSIDLIWAARGGYGAVRLLPILQQLTEQFSPPPPKLLVGYSDITILHEFVRKAWGWQTLHAPMPAADLRHLPPGVWDAIRKCVIGEPFKLGWNAGTLHWLTPPPAKPIRASLIGGNLSLWATMAGTDVQPRGRRRILFFEDVGEPPYRIDRLFQQIVQAGMADGAAAIVLGDFTNCHDEAVSCLAKPETPENWDMLRSNPSGGARVALREPIDLATALNETFAAFGRSHGIPVATHLPVGHGPNFWPLPLDARYTIKPDGSMQLWKWDWFSQR